MRSYILPLRGGSTWLCQLVCPWHLARVLVGNYTPPTTVLRGAAVLVILTSITGTAMQRTKEYTIEVCSMVCSHVYTHVYTHV